MSFTRYRFCFIFTISINRNLKKMIQRIQTIYLFAAAVIMFLLFFFPFMEMIGADGQYYRYDIYGIHQGMGETAQMSMSVLPLRFLVFVTGFLSLVIIFLYKKRILQIRLCVFNLVLTLGFYGLFYFYYYQAARDIEVETYLKVPLAFPLIAMILLYLAIRNIGKDEILVRSYNRIR